MSEEPTPKSRRGKAVKEKGKPAAFVPAPAAFDPAQIIEDLNVWWVNGKEVYLRMPPADPHERDPFKNVQRRLSAGGVMPPRPPDLERPKVLKWNSAAVQRELRMAGVGTEKGKRTFSQMDEVLSVIGKTRVIEFAGEIAGLKVGVHSIDGNQVAITKSYQLIAPGGGDWPNLRGALEARLRTAEVDQLPYFYAWCKTAYEALQAGEMRPGPLLVFTGGSDTGKSFIQEHVITPLLGGRASDPLPYLLGKTQFNENIASSEHLMIGELSSGMRPADRALLGEELKKLLVNESMPLSAKYCNPITVRPFRRVTLSLNDNIDRLQTLPMLTSDFADKVNLLRFESAPPMPGRTNEERALWRGVILSELPAFIAFLIDWQIPEEIRASSHATRFGFDAWRHPDIEAQLFEVEPESVMLWAIDHTPALFEITEEKVESCGWQSAEELRALLVSGPAGGRVERMVNKFPTAFAVSLSKLQKQMPHRFEKRHTRGGNVWMVRPSVDLSADKLRKMKGA